MVYPRTHEVKSFFHGQYFESGLRITIGILLPSLISYYQGNLTIGITLSLGALFVSITDLPGPIFHKRNGMLITSGFLFFSALLTGLINYSDWLLAIEIPLLCFFFAMLHVYGVRASLSGTAALLVMFISTDDNILLNGAIPHALLILCGGLWYTALSLAISWFRPYRLAQQTLGECILEVGSFLRLRARFYDDKTDIKENYAQLVLQQIKVNDHLDGLREILFKSRRMVQSNSSQGNLLLVLFNDVLDIFEQVMSIPYDYAVLRERFREHKVLPEVTTIVEKITLDLEAIGYALINNEKPAVGFFKESDLEKFKQKLDVLEEKGLSVFVLKKVLVSLRKLSQKVNILHGYFYEEKVSLSDDRKSDFDKFISHQKYDVRLLINNLTFDSFTFRHALRLALACFVGFIIARTFSFGEHSYWILLTILVILKPAYGLTKQRNYERVIGTVVGGLMGILILVYIGDQTAKFIILMVFMILTFTFQRIRYVVSVLFMTPFLLILFSFVSNSGDLDIAKERIIDTLVGSLLAVGTNYFIFPNWESSQVFTLLSRNIKANLDYLKMVSARFHPDAFSLTAYKLSRKQVYIEAANLSAAFQRMLSEPRKRQKHIESLHQFIVLNHILSSHLSTLSTNLETHHIAAIDPEHIRLIRKIQAILQETVANLDGASFAFEIPLPEREPEGLEDVQEAEFIGEQLTLIHKISKDLEKLSKTFNS